MQIVKPLKGLGVSLFGALNGFRFGRPMAMGFARVRQVTFPAALTEMRHNCLFVVLLAATGTTRTNTKIGSKTATS